ncbi:LacI family DNA-binding transcriptional regulator [Microlunatus ginsengisoli]|uniref:LacI family DNA-binding transcriptional regulator n=1 Tax=Microlunatus ginsengisoli TaxID=363863 RepID=A0ABP7A6D6_9ACTN
MKSPAPRPDDRAVPPQRLTIKDIAARAGVSIGSVSYALNGRPGVSEATRLRVLTVAEELGWVPDNAARRLAGAQTDTVGLVLPQGTAKSLGVAPWFMEFIGGVATVLAEAGYGMMMQVVAGLDAELDVYRKWSRGRLVDGVILVDLRADDPRIEAVRTLGLPAVVAGPPEVADGLTCVWTNDGAAAQEAVRYLAALGHRDIARVSGPADIVHVKIRQRATEETAAELGLRIRTWHTDYSVESGRRATREILLSTPRPTAILYDDDLGAVTGLAVARELNFRVPEDVSLLAWDDSNLCQTTFPPLSAMSHDVLGYGAHLTRRLLEVLAGAPPASHEDVTPRITPRASTAPPS